MQLAWCPIQKVYNRITTCHVNWSTSGEQCANILGERELTCSWVIVVPTANYFVAFANRAEDAVLAGQAYTLFGSVHFSQSFLVCENGTVLTVSTVSGCC